MHKWTSAIEGIEEVAVKEWSEGLAGMDGEQIKRGLEEWDSDWPPSLDEFKNACVGKKVNGFGLDYTPEYHRPQRKQERLLSSDARDAHRKEVSGKAVNGIKKLLNKRQRNL